MFIPKPFVLISLIGIISSTQSEVQYTEKDFSVIRSFTKSLYVNCLVFIMSEKNLSVINFLKHNLYSVVISPSQLENILNVERVRDDFFAPATMVISKESLNYTNIFQRLSEKHSSSWVMFANTLEPLQHFYIPINKDFYTVRYMSRTIIINKAYHIKPGLNITLKLAGIWQREDTDTILINKSTTYDFSRVILYMLHFLDDECKASKPILLLDRIECFQQEMLRILSDKLNYRIRKVECPERVHPYNYPNGTLSDLFTILARKGADFSSASYIVNNDRLAKYDFAWPTFTSKSMLYIKERKQNIWKGYLRPIHKKMWHAICFWIMGVGLLILVFQECRKGRFKPKLSSLLDLVISVFTSLQVFCSQGIHDMPMWYSSRIIIIMSFLLFVILYQLYSGFLISFLMNDIPYIPFSDLDGFFRNGRYKLITLDNGFHNFYTNKVINGLKKDPSEVKLPSEQLPVRVDEGIKKLCSTKRLAYVEFRENIVMHELPCKITELPNPVLYQSIGIGFPKNSPYREPINREIFSLGSTGILQRMRKRLFSYVNLEEKETSQKLYTKVSLKHVVSIFFILALGMILAWGVFFLEHLLIFSMKLTNRATIKKPQLKIVYFKMDGNLVAHDCFKWAEFILRKK